MLQTMDSQLWSRFWRSHFLGLARHWPSDHFIIKLSRLCNSCSASGCQIILVINHYVHTPTINTSRYRTYLCFLVMPKGMLISVSTTCNTRTTQTSLKHESKAYINWPGKASLITPKTFTLCYQRSINIALRSCDAAVWHFNFIFTLLT